MPGGNAMLAFQSVEDIHQLPTTHPAYPKVRELVRLCIEAIEDYDPDIHGKVYLIDPSDFCEQLPDICKPWTLYDVQWEGVTLEDGHFVCVYLGSGDYGLVFVVPDAPWLPPDLRERLLYFLDT
jgi:hypothetical protein